MTSNSARSIWHLNKTVNHVSNSCHFRWLILANQSDFRNSLQHRCRKFSQLTSSSYEPAMANQLRPVMTNHHRDHLQLGHAHRSYRPRGTSNQRHSSTVTAYSSVPFCYMLQLLLLAYTPTISNGEVVAPSTTPITTLLTTYETLPKPANYLQPGKSTLSPICVLWLGRMNFN